MAETITLASFLADLTTIITSMISWTVSVVTTVVSNPPLMVMAFGTFALVSIGILKRLIRL